VTRRVERGASQRRLRARLHLRHPGRAHRHHGAARRAEPGGDPLQRPAHVAKLARGDLRQSREKEHGVNWHGVRAIYRFEMARMGRTVMQSVLSPVISTSLYFIVFGAAIGSRITEVDGVSYGSVIVPGLVMLMLLTQGMSNAAFGVLLPPVHRQALR